MSPPAAPLLARWDALAGGTRTAVHDAEGAHAYAGIARRAKHVAAALLAGDLSPGERVAILCAPGADFVTALFGVLRAGGCAVILSPLHPPAESGWFCDDAHVRTVLVTGDMAATARGFSGSRTLSTVGELASHPIALDEPVPAADALQLYTSGTTGKPKGAVLGQAALLHQARLLHAAWGWRRDDVLLHVLPLHHMHGLAIALLPALLAGATVRMLPRFDAAATWEAMGTSTVFMAVPTIYAKLLSAFDEADATTQERWKKHASALRLATSGSAALPVTFAERWRAIAGNIPLERFGMTEIGVGLSNPLAGPRKPGSVGAPLPTVETRIVGEDGAPAATGELWVRGESLFSGYFERTEATAAAFAPADDGGAPWFRTGDTVTKDDDGTFRVLGRTSVDILKSGGYKLSALEIEEVLREHPAVGEVAVVGLPDEVWGDRVVACVILRAGARTTADELRAFAKEKLASYKVPKEVRFLDALPRNAVGKVVKPALAKQLQDGREPA
jgi:malonyl-CoA/methylmalonyl-CoA synthetase